MILPQGGILMPKTFNELPKTFNELKEEEKEKMIFYFQMKDAEGLYAYIEDAVSKLNRDRLAGKTKDYFVDTPTGAALSVLMYTLAKTTEKDEIAFREKLLKIAAKKKASSMLDTGRKYEECKQLLENGEGDGFDLLASDPKNIQLGAVALAGYKSEIGQKYLDVDGAVSSICEFSGAPDQGTALSNHFKDLLTQAIKEDDRFTPEKKDQYFDLFSHLFDSQLYIKTSTADHPGVCTKYIADKTKPTGLVFDTVPTIDTMIRSMNDKQLADYRKQLEADKHCVDEYENTAQGWTNTAKKLLQDLEANTPDAEKKTASYQKLKKVLGWNTNFGTAVTYIPLGKEDKEENELTFFHYAPSGFKTITGILKDAAEKYPNKETGNKILSAIASETEKINKALAKGADQIFKKNGHESNSSSKVIARDLRRIDAEQKNRERTLYAKMELNQNHKKIQAINQQQDNLVFFKSDVQKIQMTTKAISSWFSKDNAERKDIPEKEKDKHMEFLDLVEKASQLSEMDVTKLSPKQAYEMIEKTKKAADKYVSTHAGILNITKGWTNEAKDRIKQAEKMSKELDRRLKELNPVWKTFKNETASISTIYQDLENKKGDIRRENAVIKKASPDENRFINEIPDDNYSINFSQQSIKMLLNSVNKLDQNTAVAVYAHMADIIATTLTAKQFGNLSSQDAQAARDQTAGIILNTKPFQNLKQKTNTPEAFEKLVLKALKQNPNELILDYKKEYDAQKQIDKKAKKTKVTHPEDAILFG